MSLFDLLGAGGALYAGLDIAEDIRKVGSEGAASMQALGERMGPETAFRGYGVQTGLGRSTISPTGSLNVGVGPESRMMQQGQNLFGNVGRVYADAAGAIRGAVNPYQQQAFNALSGAANPFMAQAAGGIGAAQGMLMDASGNPLMGDAASAIQSGLSNQNFAAANQLLQQGAMNQAYGGAMSAQQGAMGGLAGQQAGALGASQQAMQQAMMDTAGREQQVFERAMALQEPGLQRAQAAQQAREFAMGRGGLRGSQFGGTAEDAAMARARAEATNQAAFQAMGQAQQEALNRANMAAQFGQLGTQAGQLQGQLGTNLGQLGLQQAQLGQQGAGMLADISQAGGQLGLQGYSAAFTPMQQQLNALQIGQQAANMAQTGQLTGAGYGAQLGLGGIQSQINAEKAASELFGNLFGAGMTAIGSIGQGAEPGTGFFEMLGIPNPFAS